MRGLLENTAVGLLKIAFPGVSMFRSAAPLLYRLAYDHVYSRERSGADGYELRVIEEIEEVGNQLEPESLRQAEVFKDANVKIVGRTARKCIATGIRISASARNYIY